MTEINYSLVLIASFFAVASPGPATLAIAATSMSQGRLKGAALATGISTGSIIWACLAALGLSAIMYTNIWLFEMLRYAGAGYLLYLAYKSARSVLSAKKLEIRATKNSSYKAAYWKGVTIHLTNPKAIFFFASLYAIAIPATANIQDVLLLNGLILTQGFLVFQGYALLFSINSVRNFYTRMQRGFETCFAAAFGFAGFKILTLELD
ncbi:MAG: LysE family translocator [Oceanospirillaceae bacterium]|nr:LysE family translocator [Oceanospirillaceae bacterium]